MESASVSMKDISMEKDISPDGSESTDEPELAEVASKVNKKPDASDGWMGKRVRLSPRLERILQSFKVNLHLSKTSVAVILIGYSFGSAVIILPNTVYRLGSVIWPIVVAMILVSTAYATYLSNQLCNYLLEHAKSLETIRDPYPAIAELAGGPFFRKVFTAFLYIATVTTSLSFILLSATLMNNTIPLGELSNNNSIRAWLFIIFVTVSPLMFLGTLSDLKITAIFSVTASTIAMICVLLNCVIVVKNQYYIGDDKSVLHHEWSGDAFIVFGLIIFASAGPSFTLPNILVHVTDRKQMPGTIAYSFGILFAIYLFAGIIPYTVFGHDTKPLITDSFSKRIVGVDATFAIAVFGAICDISMSLHLLLESVLMINPVFQLVEHYLDIPRHMSWKRILVRSCGLLLMLVFTLSVPQFRPILSLVGAVPLALVGIIFPIFMYSNLFEINALTKGVHVMISLFYVILVLGNIGVTISQIVHSLLKDE